MWECYAFLSALGSTSLWCSYPRYEITSEHLAKSLTELAMCPSAVVFVCANTPDNGQVFLLVDIDSSFPLLDVIWALQAWSTNTLCPRPFRI